MSEIKRKASPGKVSPTQEEQEKLEQDEVDKIIIEKDGKRFEFE